MQCPTCGDQPLYARMTQQGVEVDYCQQCHGVWLDKGEIFSFTKRPKELSKAFQDAQKSAKSSSRLSPKTERPMQEITFLDGKLALDVCPETEGLWFDEGEIERLVNADPRLLSLRLDNTVAALDEKPFQQQKIISGEALRRLPNRILRVIITIFCLHAPLVILLALAVRFAALPVIVACTLGVIFCGGHWLIGSWLIHTTVCRFFPIQWIPFPELPEHLHTFVTQVCSAHEIAIPSFGILADSRPNIFTYGTSQKDARIIITTGMLELLSEEELEAVTVRELDHARRWDLLVITVAYSCSWMVSLLAYSLLEQVERMRKLRFLRALPAVGVYWLSRATSWAMRGFSRTRHFFADRFAGEMTGNPNHVASAFVSITRGLTGQILSKHSASSEPQYCPYFGAIGALGIVDVNMAQSFAVSAHNAGKPLLSKGNGSDERNILGALKWELWNPWAGYYERQTSHPLLTKRIRYLMNQAGTLDLEPVFRFSQQKPESYWNEFWVDLVVMHMANLALLVFILITLLTGQQALLGLGLIVTGILAMVKFFFTYPTELFPLMTISSLFKHIKVSGVRPVPCTLKGKIVGGSGAIPLHADTLAVRDYSGITLLEYPQPLRIWEFLFRVFHSGEMSTEEVTFEGWYRRSPLPYIEIKTVSTQESTRTCHAYTLRKFMILLVILVGFVLAFVPIETLLPFL